MSSQQKRGFGARINRWLDEAPGETFKQGKWRFWFPMLIGFSILNATLTAMVFGSGGQLQTYMGGILLAVGVLLAWLCVGTLHYSDSRDSWMARGVSLLDSITLIFVIGHFCFLLWIQGHVWALQSREADYKDALTRYNEKAEKVSADNSKIAEAARQIAAEETKRARIENDTIYQARKAAQAGARISARRGAQSAAPSLTTSPVALEKPDKPKESSTDFLTRWDWWIRVTNFFELALAAATLIYIRNRSAKFNAGVRRRDDYEFPAELDDDVSVRSNAKEPRLAVAKAPQNVTTLVSQNSDDIGARKRTTLEGLKRLRECLKLIAFHHPGVHFKADVKDDCVWIRAMESKHGEQRTVASAKAKLDILDDAAKMEPAAFRARLEKFLKNRGFELSGATG